MSGNINLGEVCSEEVAKSISNSGRLLGERCVSGLFCAGTEEALRTKSNELDALRSVTGRM